MARGLNQGDIPSRDGWVAASTGQKLVNNHPEKGEEESGIPAVDQANRIAKKIKDLMEGAKIDAVLGCLNRKALEEFLNDFVPRHDGAIVYLDFRDFKPINDDYGHKNGDRILQEFVRQINANFRTTYGEDLLFRYGGDEFVLVCQHFNQETDFDGFIAKIKNKLENLVVEIIAEINNQRTEVKAGVDYGVAGYYAAHSQNEKPNLREIMDRADKEMYAYKENHRSENSSARRPSNS